MNKNKNLPLFKGRKVIFKDDIATFIWYSDDKKEIALEIEKKIDTYYFKVKNLKNGKFIGNTIKNKKNLDIQNKSRNNDLVKYLKKASKLDSKDSHNILEDIGEYLNNNPLFHDYSYDLEDSTKIWPYLEFNDYPENIKKEALDILNNTDFLQECLSIISITHEGNKDAATLILLSFASLFSGEPVHQLLGGESGEGKSDLCIDTSSIIPDKYVHKLRGSSPKYIFYDCKKFNDDYNIIINDDFQLNTETIELNKTLTDNKEKEKIHRTVINGKAEIFELKGKYLSIMNFAKNLDDKELLNRLFLNDVKDDENHRQRVKNKIKSNKMTGVEENMLLEKMKLYIKAIFQYHIDKNIKVFNPYIEFLDFSKIDNRNINYLISFINAKTFYSYSNRKTINGITIGTKEDLKTVLELWKNREIIQEYKLSHIQEEILKNLLPYVEGFKESIDDMPLFDSEISVLDTISSLAKKIYKKRSTVDQAIKGRKDSTQPGLEDLNLIVSVYIDPDNPRKGKLIFLNPDYENEFKALKNGFDINALNKNINEYQFDTPNSKITLLHQFLAINNITINNIIKNKIEEYIKKEDYVIGSYEALCEFLEKFINILKEEDMNTPNDYKTIKNNFNFLKK